MSGAHSKPPPREGFKADSSLARAVWHGWARLCLDIPTCKEHPTPIDRRGKPGLQFVAVPGKAAQGPQMNLSFSLLLPPHSSLAPVHIALSPMGREHSLLQPLSYSSSLPKLPLPCKPPPSHPNPPGCLPTSSISAVTSQIDSTQKTCGCRSRASNCWQPDGLRARKMLKLSRKAAGKSP